MNRSFTHPDNVTRVQASQALSGCSKVTVKTVVLISTREMVTLMPIKQQAVFVKDFLSKTVMQ